MKVLAINDKNRPNEIPSDKWIKEGEEYTVTKVMKCNVQGGIYGYQLAEIDISMYSPYEYFAAYRFAVNISPPDEVSKEELELVA
jgi:hypothetical protein